MHKSTALLVLTGAFLVGVLFRSVYFLPPGITWGFLFCGVLGLGICLGVKIPKVVLCISIISTVLLGAGIGIGRIAGELQIQNEFVHWLGGKQDFEGVVVAEPDIRPDKQLLTIRPDGFRQSILVTLSRSGFFQYGDRVWVRGKVVSAEEFDGFDYPGFLAKSNIYALSRYPKVVVLKNHQGNWVYEKIFDLKSWFTKRIQQVYPEPESGLLLGLLIGARRGLPDLIREQFVRTGTSHVMAVSGFNIAIFIGGLSGLAFFFGRKFTLFISFITIAVFVILVGPSGSVLRAAGMGYAMLLAINIGRLYFPLNIMLLVAGAMTLINPRILFWDVGFQLSLAATVGIILVYPLAKLYLDTKLKAVLFGPLVITLAATLFTLPLTLWQFEQLSVVGPVANVLLAPVIEIAMGFGALSFLPFMGVGFAYVNYFVLKYMLVVVEYLSRPAWAVQAYILPGSLVVVCYVILLVLFELLQKRLLSKHLA
jgi:competence protein ComEC